MLFVCFLVNGPRLVMGLSSYGAMWAAQVCRRWRHTAGINIMELRPVKPKLHLLPHLALGITSLDLSGEHLYLQICPMMRM